MATFLLWDLFARSSSTSTSKISDGLTEQNTRKLIVATIDLGTTYSNWAYSLYTDFEKDPTQVECRSWNSGKHISSKAPTTVLIQPDGKTIEAFGYEAENRYAQLVEDGKDKSYYYFHRFKMLLCDNKTLRRNDSIKDANSKRLPAKTVFSLVIGSLREDLLKELDSKVSGIITDKDIQWVLTVPAMWNFRAKQFMRECAVEAGIKSTELIIALEPEAALFYCKYLKINKKNGGLFDCKMSAFEPGTQYMIVDAGGGTVDIVVHKVNDDGSSEEISASTGGNWGGTNVDMAFFNLLSDIYGEDYIQRLKYEYVDDYLELLRDIEVKKRTITPGMTQKLVLRVPFKLNEMYTAEGNEDIIERVKRHSKLNGHISFKADKIYFDPELMFAIFSETTAKVVDHLSTILSDVSFTETDVILMVGGYSESPMLFNAVEMAFTKYIVKRPPDAGMSVLKGAVIFGHSRKDVKVRVSPYTYGFCLQDNYDPARHDESHLFVDENGKYLVKDAFCRLVQINERISIDEETARECVYPLGKAESFSLHLFGSEESDPIYTDDSSCFPVGNLIVDCRDDDGNVGGAKVSFKFGGTEVEARAILKSNGKLTSTTFNFLD